jgi:hypothetical protein
LEFWAKAVNMAVYIKNWCPTKFLIQNPHKKHGLVESPT